MITLYLFKNGDFYVHDTRLQSHLGGKFKLENKCVGKGGRSLLKMLTGSDMIPYLSESPPDDELLAVSSESFIALPFSEIINLCLRRIDDFTAGKEFPIYLNDDCSTFSLPETWTESIINHPVFMQLALELYRFGLENMKVLDDIGCSWLKSKIRKEDYDKYQRHG